MKLYLTYFALVFKTVYFIVMDGLKRNGRWDVFILLSQHYQLLLSFD